MSPSISQLAASALTLFSVVQGHMIMTKPVPYLPEPTQGPLASSDFPCQSHSYDVATENFMAIGEPQALEFKGDAVHGGGSCQVSLTADRSPTKDSKWMVIKSIEGGCPSSAAGNLGSDPNGTGASKFQFTIPEGITPGEYTMAWTWLNKIGNREFYMNCAPATVVAAKKKRYAPEGISLVRKQATFPDMFVANVAGINDCVTPETFDYNYPNPGDVIQSAGTGPYTNLACAAAGGSNAAPTSVAAGSPVASSAAQPTNTDAISIAPLGAPTGTLPASQPAASAGIFASGAASQPAASAPATATTVPVVPVASTPAVSAPAPSATGGASTGTTSAGQQTPGAPCSPEGTWLCLGKSYQRCASGQWSPVMSLAAGMSCTPGMSQNINMAPGKRSTSWARRADGFKA